MARPETDWVPGQFGADRAAAVGRFAAFVAAGVGQASIWNGLRNQVFLGGDTFVERMAGLAAPGGELRDVARVQRRSMARSLDWFERHFPDRRAARAGAFRTGAYTMQQIGAHFGVHYATVSRAVRRYSEGGSNATMRHLRRRCHGVCSSGCDRVIAMQ
jgi:hypothetical protein